MIRFVLIALLLIAGFAHGADNPATTTGAETSAADGDASPTSIEDVTESTASEDTEPERPRSTGSLRETVTETMRTFTPSESIDVDKAVPFPVNI